MTDGNDGAVIRSLAALEALYDAAARGSIVKECDHIHPLYRPFIEAAPFVVLATAGPEGPDLSPRGDGPGFLRVTGAREVLMPDRRGNNRLDSLRNIVSDPRVALLFIVPGVGETLRLTGRAEVTTDPGLCASFAQNGQSPRVVVRIAVCKVFFQCSRAVLRAKLWDPGAQIPRSALPSPGAILAALSGGEVGGAAYDEALPARLRDTLY